MKTKSEISAYVLRCSAVAVLLSCVIVAFTTAINVPNRSHKVSTPQNDSAFGVNAKENGSSVAASAIQRNRTLTFADRVAYQRAIEEVYWQHRTWPKENARPKPRLDEVMSQAEIEKKVEEYLRDLQALEDYWQRPITPDQLQAEMERMASHTKQPGVLRELFEALGNDRFVIAECLARPALAEHLVNNLYVHDQRFHGELKQRAAAELQAHNSVEQMKQTSGTYSETELVRSDSAQDKETGGSASPEDDGKANRQRRDTERAVRINSPEWDETVQKLAASFNKPDAAKAAAFGVRRYSAAFESADMSAHSKKAAASEYETLPVGVLGQLQEDDAHYYAVAVMTKGKDRLKLATIAWLKEPLRSWLAKAETQLPVTMVAVSASYALPVIASPSGGCSDDTWTPTSLTNAPAGRIYHTVVWTGSEMIVWGGGNFNTNFNTGGKYNPVTDSWTPTSTTNAPAGRSGHTAVWTGSEMIVWGGGGLLNTGGRYNPSTDTWIATSITGAPTYRSAHTAVWTGSEMIVWGGQDVSGDVNTGGRYNPITDSWTATSTTNAPAGRQVHTAVWTGSQMIVWGGSPDSGFSYLNTGGRYDPITDSWTATTLSNAPAAREYHTAVWTGSEMIVWGGWSGGSNYLNTGGRYNPSPNSWTATSLADAPAGRDFHAAVWTGSQMIVWGGYGNSGSFNTGGRYDPSTDNWTATSTSGAPVGRFHDTGVWTGSQMIVWGGYNGSYVNTGGRYCATAPGSTPTPTPTPTATATATPTATQPPSSATPTATPTPTPTPTGTPRPTPTPRLAPTPRPRPTTAPRP